MKIAKEAHARKLAEMKAQMARAMARSRAVNRRRRTTGRGGQRYYQGPTGVSAFQLTIGDDKPQVAKLIKGLFGRRLIADVSEFNTGVKRMYKRGSKVVSTPGQLRLVGTTSDRRVSALLSYVSSFLGRNSTPDLLVTPLATGSGRYLGWVKRSTGWRRRGRRGRRGRGRRGRRVMRSRRRKGPRRGRPGRPGRGGRRRRPAGFGRRRGKPGRRRGGRPGFRRVRSCFMRNNKRVCRWKWIRRGRRIRRRRVLRRRRVRRRILRKKLRSKRVPKKRRIRRKKDTKNKPGKRRVPKKVLRRRRRVMRKMKKLRGPRKGGRRRLRIRKRKINGKWMAWRGGKWVLWRGRGRRGGRWRRRRGRKFKRVRYRIIRRRGKPGKGRGWKKKIINNEVWYWRRIRIGWRGSRKWRMMR